MKNSTFIKNLRKNATDVEMLLWAHLRNRRLGGYKFRRQAPVGSYIVDFICIEKKLVVELDGGQHQDQSDYDTKRTQYLNSCGLQVIRFWNNEVLENLDGVLTTLLKEAKILNLNSAVKP